MVSPLATSRKKYTPKVPTCLQAIEAGQMRQASQSVVASDDQEKVAQHFPHSVGLSLMEMGANQEGERKPLKVGVVLSGGQAPGGHNVIAGLFDALKTHHKDSTLIGFLKGPKGILTNNYLTIDERAVEEYRNQGGFDMIGSGRDKIESEQDLAGARTTCEDNELDGLVIIGGDDSNTNAACVAEYFLDKGVKTSVVGVPKTIDGDLQNDYVPISFGFDTATKVYAYLISNIQRDAKSSCKYTHFVKLMGRSASHVALECALQTHPNYTLISEEVKEKGFCLHDVVQKLADVVCARVKEGKPYGVFLIPEGVIEFIPDVGILIGEINQIGAEFRAQTPAEEFITVVEKQLSEASKSAWNLLPYEIRQELVMDTDPHGNVQVSHIQTEKLLASIIKEELKKREKALGEKIPFAPVYHFLGYEGRSTFPTNFDANYCYSLGLVAYLLIKGCGTGRMCALRGLAGDVSNWEPLGVPITSLMNFETRKGKLKPVIKKALVELDSKAFKEFKRVSPSWELTDDEQGIGPIQFEGSPNLTDNVPVIVRLASSN